MIVALLPGASAPGRVEIRVEGLRSTTGLVSVCMTMVPADFPYCDKDPKALHRSVNAGPGVMIIFDDLPSGSYAAAILHDENGNGKMDTRFGIPREGVAFSRNPVVRFSAPKFPQAVFPVADKPVSLTVQMKYFL